MSSIKKCNLTFICKASLPSDKLERLSQIILQKKLNFNKYVLNINFFLTQFAKGASSWMHLCENWEFENENEKKNSKNCTRSRSKAEHTWQKGFYNFNFFSFQIFELYLFHENSKSFCNNNKQTLKSANLDFSIFLWWQKYVNGNSHKPLFDTG